MSLPQVARDAIEKEIASKEDLLEYASDRTEDRARALRQVTASLEQRQREYDEAKAAENRLRNDVAQLRSALIS